MNFQCQELPATAIDQASKVLANAFSNSPGYQYIFRDDTVEQRKIALEWVFTRNLTIIQKRCPTAFRGILNDDGEVIACFLWIPSSHVEISTWELLKAGLWQMPFLFGIPTVLRLLKMMDTFDSGTKHHLLKDTQEEDDDDDFIMLERMAVRPDYQGQGIGSKCLQSAILAEQTSSTKRKIHLGTQEERNVEFYSRLGFRIAGEVDMFQEESKNAFHTWYMSLTI